MCVLVWSCGKHLIKPPCRVETSLPFSRLSFGRFDICWAFDLNSHYHWLVAAGILKMLSVCPHGTATDLATNYLHCIRSHILYDFWKFV